VPPALGPRLGGERKDQLRLLIVGSVELVRAITSDLVVDVRPDSMRQSLWRDQPSSSAAISAVYPAATRSARARRPSWRRGTVDPASVMVHSWSAVLHGAAPSSRVAAPTAPGATNRPAGT
jgi:hypothetical protein